MGEMGEKKVTSHPESLHLNAMMPVAVKRMSNIADSYESCHVDTVRTLTADSWVMFADLNYICIKTEMTIKKKKTANILNAFCQFGPV